VTGSASGSPFADGIVMDNLEVIGTDGSIRHLATPDPESKSPGRWPGLLGCEGGTRSPCPPGRRGRGHRRQQRTASRGCP
jgi:hypothetical protein